MDKISVRSYTVTHLKVFFPDDRVCCAFCPLLETYAREQCRMTGEYIADDRGQGMWCPLVIQAVEENDEDSF